MPYFTASSPDRKLSRSVSRAIFSTRLAGVLGEDLVQALAQVQDFLGVDLDVRGLALEAAHRLVDHDARIGQREALVLVARRQQQRAHARGLPDAQRADVGLDELHGVVDGEARGHRAAGRVDVEEDVLVRVLGLEEQQLRDDQVGGDFGHRADQEHHPLLQQARVDVVGALAPPGLLDHHRDQAEVLRVRRALLPVHHLPPISSSKGTALSATFALESTQFTTLPSSARPSISDRRCGCM